MGPMDSAMASTSSLDDTKLYNLDVEEVRWLLVAACRAGADPHALVLRSVRTATSSALCAKRSMCWWRDRMRLWRTSSRN